MLRQISSNIVRFKYISKMYGVALDLGRFPYVFQTNDNNLFFYISRNQHNICRLQAFVCLTKVTLHKFQMRFNEKIGFITFHNIG